MYVNTLGYVPFSEKRVIKSLIENRSKVDKSYVAPQEGADAFSSSGALRMSEEIIVVYAALDE